MRDRSGEISRAGATPSAPAAVGAFAGLERRGEMSELQKTEYDALKKQVRVDTQVGGALLSAEEATAQLEKAIGARWAKLSDAQKERLVESAMAEQRRLTANDDASIAKKKAPTLDPPESAVGANARHAPPHPDDAEQPKPPKRKRGRPPKEQKNTQEISVANTAQKAPTAVYIASGAAPALAPEIDPGLTLPGAQRVRLTAADGVVASSVPPGGEQLVGHAVEGIVDGEFAQGYFLTVRINGCLLRGMVWDEHAGGGGPGQNFTLAGNEPKE
jgi:hypothetical protein